MVPLPEYVIALGDAQAAAGHPDDAARSYELAKAEIQLFKSAGVVVDVDLALLEADHGDPTAALGYATAAYQATPTIRAADALAWALHRLGRDDEARKRSTEATRLGSIDPIIRFHAGMIEAALGDRAAARRDLEQALRTDPGFSATSVAEARRILASGPDSATPVRGHHPPSPVRCSCNVRVAAESDPTGPLRRTPVICGLHNTAACRTAVSISADEGRRRACSSSPRRAPCSIAPGQPSSPARCSSPPLP